jgi:P27 family predicted phage terminase small subunit
MGRPPRPTELKLIEGRRPGKDSGGRPIPEVPAFKRGEPVMPIWLPDEARAEWRRVVPELSLLGLLKLIDGAALVAYCMTWQRFVDACAIVAREGMVVQDDRQGRAQRHPALLTVEAASKELRAWCTQFGMTPSAEQRVAAAKADDGQQGNPFAATG